MEDTSNTRYNPLRALLDEMHLTTSVPHLLRLGRKLAQISGKATPYSYPYLNQVANGKLQPGKILARAIEAALAEIDGADPLLVTAQEAQVMVPEGWDGTWAYLPMDARICDKEDCLNRFIPNTPKRRACYRCSPIRKGQTSD